MPPHPHPTHDSTPNTICLCPTCIDDIALFVTSLTNLPQARAVTAHILAKHQAQLLQISALTSVLEEKDPVIRLLRQQLEVLQAQLQGYWGDGDGDRDRDGYCGGGGDDATEHRHRSTSSTQSRSSNEEQVEEREEEREEEETTTLTQLAHLKQQLRSKRKQDHPAAMRLRAAANEYANRAHEREMEAEEEAQEWAWYAEELRGRVAELAACEQWAVDSQIWREMGEGRECFGHEGMEMEMVL